MTRPRDDTSNDVPVPPEPPRAPADVPAEEPDIVEHASEDSFPASDSPPWTPLHPGAPATHPDRR